MILGYSGYLVGYSMDFKDFEIIIINDGSTDKSLQEVEKVNDFRISVFDQQNLGLSTARNSGIKKAKSNYIAFIDADDLWHTHHLEQLYNLIDSFPNKGMYCTGYTTQKSDTVFHRAHFNDLPKEFRGIVPDFFKHSLQNCVAWISAICIPKVVFNDIGYFDSDIISEQDTDLYIRIALKYDVVLDNSSVSAIYNRTMEYSLSSTFYKKNISKLFYKHRQVEANHVSLKKYIDYYRFSSTILFKISSNNELSNSLIKDIDLKNLNLWQRLLIWLPNYIVKFLFFIKNTFYLSSLFVYKPKI